MAIEMSVESLAELLHETAEHHDPFEKVAPDHDGWDWYADYRHALCLTANLFRIGTTRMHSATKPQVLGLLLVLLGLGLRLRDPASVGLLALVALFLLTTSPIASHMVGQASFRAGQVRHDLLVVDELTDVLPEPQETPKS
jgi:monovalent cation/proton antiporter MnhG/PhaG subunit